MKNSFFCKITSLVLTACLLLPSEIVNATDSVDVPSEEDAHGELNGKVLYNDSGAGQRTYTVSIPTKVYLNKDTCECKYPVSCKGEVGTGKEVHVWVQDDSEQDGTNIIFKQNNDVTQTFVADVNPYELDFAYNEINPDTFVEKTDVNINAVGIDTSVDWSSDITFLFQLQNQDKGHEHVDYNSDGVCDEDGCNEHVHYDVNNDGVCDKEDCKFIMGSHTHNFSTENIITPATCTTVGEKEVICICGEKKTQEIPATGHTYENGVCTECHAEKPDPNIEMLRLAPEGEIHKWYYDLEDGYIILDRYTSSNPYAMVYDAYPVNGITYKTKLKSNSTIVGGAVYSDYLFAGNKYVESVKVGANIDFSETAGLVGMFCGCTKLKTVKFYNKNFGSAVDLTSMFSGCTVLADCNITSLDLSNTTRMSNMFYNCKTLTDITFKDDAFLNVTEVNSLFAGCTGLPSDFVFDYSMPKVTNVSRLVSNCTNITNATINIKDNDGSLQKINGLFGECTNLKEVSFSGNFSNFIYVSCLFDGCSSLTNIDLSVLENSRINDFYSMFRGCTKLTQLDLSMIDFTYTQQSGYSYMFKDCSSLATILVNDTWRTDRVKDSYDVFKNCKAYGVSYVH